jgi:hypothetical protein
MTKTKVRGHERGTLKGWKLVDREGTWVNKDRNESVMIYRQVEGDKWKWIFVVNTIRGETNRKEFYSYSNEKAKSQALAYAKDWMRKHSKG